MESYLDILLYLIVHRAMFSDRKVHHISGFIACNLIKKQKQTQNPLTPIKTNDIFFLVLHLITELNILQLFKLKLCSYILLQFKIQLTLKLILLLDLTLI